MHGHFQGELWGLCQHPTLNELFTVGEDNLVRRWSIVDRTVLNTTWLTEQARALSVASNGEYVVIGTVTGKIIVTDINLNIIE